VAQCPAYTGTGEDYEELVTAGIERFLSTFVSADRNRNAPTAPELTLGRSYQPCGGFGGLHPHQLYGLYYWALRKARGAGLKAFAARGSGEGFDPQHYYLRLLASLNYLRVPVLTMSRHEI
jgi:hypothetical protein